MRALLLAFLLALSTPAWGQSSVYKIVTPAYGELYEDAGATAITVTTAGTYYQWVSSTAGVCVNVTCSVASDNITLSIAGDYRIIASISFSGTANATSTWRVFRSGSGLTNCDAQRKLGAGGDVGAVSVVCITAITAGQTLDLRVTSDSNGDTYTPTHLTFAAFRLGP